jgi:hypothetical protein
VTVAGKRKPSNGTSSKLINANTSFGSSAERTKLICALLPFYVPFSSVTPIFLLSIQRDALVLASLCLLRKQPLCADVSSFFTSSRYLPLLNPIFCLLTLQFQIAGQNKD